METNKEGDVTLSVVMPAYNEGTHITDNLLETSRVLSGFVKRYEIIAVDDGSADNTAECIRRAEMQDTHIRGISYQPMVEKDMPSGQGSQQQRDDTSHFWIPIWNCRRFC